MNIDRDRALQHLLDLLAIEGLSGRETAVAEAVTAKLVAAGCDPAWIRHDDAHTRIDPDWRIGNLIARLPGTTAGEPLLFASHMDTVPVTQGAQPRVEGGRIVSQEGVGLGADNRTAVACLVTLAETLLQRGLPHPPLTLLFTVGEEVGLLGAREVDPADLGHPVMGFNYDAGDPNEICTAAIGADRWEVELHGVSAHAGLHPEEGVSTILAASRAIAAMAEAGWWGRIEKDGRLGTANVGAINGGLATNEVTRHLHLKGESRSHDAEFLGEITAGIRHCFEQAAASVTNTAGEAARLDFRAERDYGAFAIPDDAPVVQRTLAIARAMGLEPFTRSANGGLDANYFNAKGIPTVTLGAGQHGAHTIDEYADIKEFLTGCELAVNLAST